MTRCRRLLFAVIIPAAVTTLPATPAPGPAAPAAVPLGAEVLPTPAELSAEVNDLSLNPFRAEGTLASPADGDIVVLPALIVRANRGGDIPELELYTRQGLMDLLTRRYLTEFDAGVLNRFTLPLFGSASRDRRVWEKYEREQIRELKDLGRTLHEPDFDLGPPP